MASSSAAKLLQEYDAAPAAKLARELAVSPAAKLASELSQSSAAAILRDVESPATQLAREIGLPSSAELTAMASTAKMLAGITIDPSVANMLAGVKPFHIKSPFADAIAKIQAHRNFAGVRRHRRSPKGIFRLSEPHGGFANAMKAIQEQKSLVASLAGTVGDIARMSRGQALSAKSKSLISASSIPHFQTLRPKSRVCISQFDRLPWISRI